MSTRKNATKQLRVTALACLAVATLVASATAEEKFQKLRGGQIRGKLGGMELTDNVHWRDLYQRNGTVMSTSMGASEPANGVLKRTSYASSSRKSRYRNVTTCGSLENRSSCGAKGCCHCKAPSRCRADATNPELHGVFVC
jgi:hypothetical protein